MRTAIVVGNPKPRSRTYDAAALVLERLTGRPPDLVVDVVDLGAGLLDRNDPAVAHAETSLIYEHRRGPGIWGAAEPSAG